MTTPLTADAARALAESEATRERIAAQRAKDKADREMRYALALETTLYHISARSSDGYTDLVVPDDPLRVFPDAALRDLGYRVARKDDGVRYRWLVEWGAPKPPPKPAPWWAFLPGLRGGAS